MGDCVSKMSRSLQIIVLSEIFNTDVEVVKRYMQSTGSNSKVAKLNLRQLVTLHDDEDEQRKIKNSDAVNILQLRRLHGDVDTLVEELTGKTKATQVQHHPRMKANT